MFCLSKNVTVVFLLAYVQSQSSNPVLRGLIQGGPTNADFSLFHGLHAWLVPPSYRGLCAVP